jgi:hypothetical protein
MVLSRLDFNFSGDCYTQSALPRDDAINATYHPLLAFLWLGLLQHRGLGRPYHLQSYKYIYRIVASYSLLSCRASRTTTEHSLFTEHMYFRSLEPVVPVSLVKALSMTTKP